MWSYSIKYNIILNTQNYIHNENKGIKYKKNICDHVINREYRLQLEKNKF